MGLKVSPKRSSLTAKACFHCDSVIVMISEPLNTRLRIWRVKASSAQGSNFSICEGSMFCGRSVIRLSSDAGVVIIPALRAIAVAVEAKSPVKQNR